MEHLCPLRGQTGTAAPPGPDRLPICDGTHMGLNGPIMNKMKNERPVRGRAITPYFRTKPARRPGKVIALAITLAFSLHPSVALTQTERPLPPAASEKTRPVEQPQDRGWVMFDDEVGVTLNIPADKLQQLRDVDGSYQKEYMGLGNDPAVNPGYASLNERRNNDIRRVLTAEQYEQWVRRYNRPAAAAVVTPHP